MAQRVAVGIEIGSYAPIELVRGVLDSLDTMCQFGAELSYYAAVNSAQLTAMQFSQSQEFRERVANTTKRTDALRFPNALILPALGPLVSRYLSGRNADDDETFVESVSYGSPAEIILAAGTVTVFVLQLIQSWRPRRRIMDAQADDVTHTMESRGRLREFVVTQILAGNIPLTEAQINALLTPDVEDAFRMLNERGFRIDELPEGGHQQSEDDER
jgi:hypothetical protein